MINTLTLLACTNLAHTLATSQQFEDELLKLGLRLSHRHAAAFDDLFRGEFFQAEDKRKGKRRNRTKRAFWGLDKFFIDAQKTKHHFGGLTDRVGDVFEDEEEDYEVF